ncbi:MAG: hypothetical protein IKF05_03990 [Erysipelotrichaceae bacterium]|nr:hypothetical protein [Erysipelotrichaceae bacterium]
MEIENLSQLNDHELLMELINEQRDRKKKETIRTILIIVVLLAVGAFVWYQVHQLLAMIETVRVPLETMSATIDQYAAAFGDFDFKSIETIADAFKGFDPKVLEDLSETFKQFDPKTLETMTKDINDIMKVLDQFKKIFGM